MRGSIIDPSIFHVDAIVSVVTSAVISMSSGEPEVGQSKSDRATSVEMIVNLPPWRIESHVGAPDCRVERQTSDIAPITKHHREPSVNKQSWT